MAMPDSHRCTWNHNLIKTMEEIVVFPAQKVFISVSFFFVSTRNAQVTLADKPKMKIINIKKRKQ